MNAESSLLPNFLTENRRCLIEFASTTDEIIGASSEFSPFIRSRRAFFEIDRRRAKPSVCLVRSIYSDGLLRAVLCRSANS